jgi:hypothetical protein
LAGVRKLESVVIQWRRREFSNVETFWIEATRGDFRFGWRVPLTPSNRLREVIGSLKQ